MAAALPKKIAMPSRPESRNPSRAALPSSTANARPTASSAARSTAVQKRPGRDPRQQAAVRIEGEREEDEDDRAERQHLLQRDARSALDAQVLARDEQPSSRCEVSSARRSVRPPSTAAGLAVGRPRGSPATACGLGPRDDRDLAGREPPRQIDLVRRERTVRPSAAAFAEHFVDHRATLGVESGVRLVEQQQPRVACERDGEREAAALSLRQPAVRDAGELGETDPRDRGVGLLARAPGGARRRTARSR